MSAVKLEECRERIRAELDNVVDFWLKYSHDTVHGYCSDTYTLFYKYYQLISSCVQL